MKRILLFPESAEGTAPAKPADQPPAAAAVLDSGAKPEDAAELVRLKRERDEQARLRKDREVRISELEDENKRLKDIPREPKPAPAKAARKTGWLDMYRTPSGDDSEA